MQYHGVGDRPARRVGGPIRGLPLRFLLGSLLSSMLGGCAVIDVQRSTPLDLTARWALLPILDYTETTMAGARVEDPLSTLMRQKFLLDLTKYPVAADADALADLDERQRYQQALD